jgi:hypothetical protein
MKQVIILTFTLLCIALKSQTKVGYTHDLNGNRIQRYFIGLKPPKNTENTGDSSSVTSSTNQVNQEIENQNMLVAKYGIVVYPNPTKDVICLSINKTGENAAELNKNTKLYLMNNGGDILAQQKYTGEVNTFNLSHQPAGEYYIRIIFNEAESVTYKIVKIN